MGNTESAWYEMIGQPGVSPNQMVQCDFYAHAASLAEIEPLILTCRVPAVKFLWKILDRAENTVLQRVHEFSAEGVDRIALKDVLPLEELKVYETDMADYSLNTTVTLITGHEVSGSFSFRVSLRKGQTATAVPQMDLRAQLEAIPIANASMTEEQLRQICLDYIRLETEFPFKFREDFVYTVESQKRARRLLGGKIYGGMPYVTRGAGNLYRIAEIYDPATGELDATSDLFDNIRLFGNACSGAASMAWARVVSSAYLGYTMFMTEANGFLPVGPYRYSKENVTQFIRTEGGYNCRTICQENGEQTMFESYAMMKPADGLVCNGHVRMNSVVPTVVRNADGTIDPDASFTYVREQVCYVGHRNHLRVAPDGSHYTAQGRVEYHNTFRQLLTEGYIPFTFAEFQDPTLVRPARIRLAVEPELKERVLSANYAISDVFAELDGKRYVYRNMEFFRKEVKLGEIFPAEALTKDTKITCRLYNGQLLEVQQ